MRYLFMGGAADGQWLDVPFNDRVPPFWHNVKILDAVPVKLLVGYERKLVNVPVTQREELYQREAFDEHGIRHYVYVSAAIYQRKERSVLEVLLQGYRRVA